jgi:hypothetical protein
LTAVAEKGGTRQASKLPTASFSVTLSTLAPEWIAKHYENQKN